MDIFAFQGLCYRTDPILAGRRGGPPYDQIDESLRDRLHADEHHFAHLIRPVAGGEDDPHREAARLHAEWQTTGIVSPDSRPSLYPYEIRLAAGGGRRLGLGALVALEEPASGVIRPHEQTVAKTVDERLGLLRSTLADFEPILVLSDDRGQLDQLLSEDLERLSPLVDHRDDAGHRHLLYRLTEPDRIASYRRLLEPCTAVIADGHHRWEVARRFAEETNAKPGTPAATKLSVITSLSSSALTIDPIHRALPEVGALGEIDGVVLSRRAWTGGSGRELAAAVAESRQPALGVWERGRAAEIWTLDPGAAPVDLPAGARELTVTLLHGALLPAFGLPASAATDGTVVYRSDPEHLFSELQSGDLAVGFWLPPMSAPGFSRAVAEGDLLPPKSTRFLPKLASGLVWAAHDTKLG
ncbi:MAG: DUF1015 domain-containing protein [Thermoanaerobaculia bacterium]